MLDATLPRFLASCTACFRRPTRRFSLPSSSTRIETPWALPPSRSNMSSSSDSNSGAKSTEHVSRTCQLNVCGTWSFSSMSRPQRPFFTFDMKSSMLPLNSGSASRATSNICLVGRNLKVATRAMASKKSTNVASTTCRRRRSSSVTNVFDHRKQSAASSLVKSPSTIPVSSMSVSHSFQASVRGSLRSRNLSSAAAALMQ
mmetsp:Transcript_25834/g.72601  ORF Transcript_25834/g.72601 Transcript_25834/m.72601 type:complete len:201 (+) Transcript_25834:195-797(+)